MIHLCNIVYILFNNIINYHTFLNLSHGLVNVNGFIFNNLPKQHEKQMFLQGHPTIFLHIYNYLKTMLFNDAIEIY